MRKRDKGNGLVGISNLDRHIYTKEELEDGRRKNKEFFREYDEEKAEKRLS